MTEGIDVSVYQTVTPTLTGLEFLFARASVGAVKDGRYPQHVKAARAAGLIVGAYHFGYTGSTGAQVATFLDAAGDVDLYVLDVEGPNAQSRQEAASFIKAVQAAGKVCGLYHSESGYFDAGQDFDWVAKWSPTPPSRHWDFWQYRGSPLDLDRFNGTQAELAALARHASVPPQRENVLNLIPGIVYKTAILVKPGAKVLGTPGGKVIYITKPGERFPEVGDFLSNGGDYHVMRMPGDIAGYLAHGFTLGTVPI